MEKTVCFKIDLGLYRRFVAAFPEYGARSAVLRTALLTITKLREEENDASRSKDKNSRRTIG